MKKPGSEFFLQECAPDAPDSLPLGVRSGSDLKGRDAGVGGELLPCNPEGDNYASGNNGSKLKKQGTLHFNISIQKHRWHVGGRGGAHFLQHSWRVVVTCIWRFGFSMILHLMYGAY